MAVFCAPPNAHLRRPSLLLPLVFVPQLCRYGTTRPPYGFIATHATQDFDGAWWNFIPKVIADQTVWSVFLNAAYSTTIMGLQGKSPDEVRHWQRQDKTRHGGKYQLNCLGLTQSLEALGYEHTHVVKLVRRSQTSGAASK